MPGLSQKPGEISPHDIRQRNHLVTAYQRAASIKRTNKCYVFFPQQIRGWKPYSVPYSPRILSKFTLRPLIGCVFQFTGQVQCLLDPRTLQNVARALKKAKSRAASLKMWLMN